MRAGACRLCPRRQRAPEDARVSIERGQNRHNRAVQDVATTGRHLSATLANDVVPPNRLQWLATFVDRADIPRL